MQLHSYIDPQKQIIRKGEIYYADMGDGVGSEQKGVRPVLIIQNNAGNIHSTTTIVASITSSEKKMHLPVHLYLPSEDSGLNLPSVVLCEQIRTIDKSRLIRRVSSLSPQKMAEVEVAIRRSLGM